MKRDSEIKIIVDTNLWISFLIGRKLSCLLELLSHCDVEIIVSKELLDEIYNVTSRPKLAKYFSSDSLKLLWAFMFNETKLCTIEKVPLRCRDLKDDYLLELALISNADYLITGDKDLLSMEKMGNCQIVTVMEFDAIAQSMGNPPVLHEDLEDYISIIIG